MQYIDRIYGQFEITEPVLLELINCPAMQRLKGIDQVGYVEPFLAGTGHSRFEHSMGVFLLLRRFGATLEEQIAGLIHDVSHSVFSHCIDFLFETKQTAEKSYQDNIFSVFVKNTDIPDILQKHGLDIEYILDDKNFPLKETALPDICADRLDYSLRDGIIYGAITLVEAQNFLDNLVIEENRWIFKDLDIAKRYFDYYFLLNNKYFTSFSLTVMFLTVSEYLKYAWSKKYITRDDLYTTDAEVLKKISTHLSEDKKLNLLFDRMNNKIKFKNDLDNYDFYRDVKSRMIDPLCWHKGKLGRVTDFIPELKELVKNGLKPKEYFIKFER